MASSEVYPVGNSIEELIKSRSVAELDRSVTIRQVLDLLAETTLEYEHGSADVEDIDKSLTISVYGEVIKDLILTIVNVLE